MRKLARENAFKLIYQSLFHEDIETAKEESKKEISEDELSFMNEILEAYENNKNEVYEIVKANIKGYEVNRVFKIDLALLYLALTEIKFIKTPKSIVINEVVELAKIYSTEKSFGFINAFLSGVFKEEA